MESKCEHGMRPEGLSNWVCGWIDFSLNFSELQLGGKVLLEPAAAMVHMFSLVMFGLCSPCSLTNQWDKLPIDLLEVYFPKWELPWRLI